MSTVQRTRGPFREALKNFRRWWRRWRADVHVVSFPKSGRTWLVLLMAKAIESHYGTRRRNPLRLRSYHSRRQGIPFMHAHHDGGPEFLSPEEIASEKTFYQGRKVILLVRDPRDVLLSGYFQKTKRNYNYEGCLDDYLTERRGGIESIVRFYNVWAQNSHVPRDFLMVTYEDLHRDTAAALRRVLTFIGLDQISDEAITAAVDECRFENMRRLEEQNAYRTGALSARDPADVTTYKTRQGRVGGYHDYFTPAQVEWLNSKIDGELDPVFGMYLSSARSDAAEPDHTQHAEHDRPA